MDSSRKKLIGFIVFAVIGICACLLRFYFDFKSEPALFFYAKESVAEESDTQTQPSFSAESDHVLSGTLQVNSQERLEEPIMIPVYLCGAVHQPGVYYIQKDSFLFELFDLAGGPLPDAAIEHINWVMQLSEPISIYIPLISEISNPSVEQDLLSNPSFLRREKEEFVWGGVENQETPSSLHSELNDKININTADQTALMTLSGVGEVTATAIIEYRNVHGSFSKIEDIMKVPGIKQARFDAIKNKIEV